MPCLPQLISPCTPVGGFLLDVNKVFKEYKGILIVGDMALAASGFGINVYIELKAMDSKFDAKFAVLEDGMNTIIKLQTERDSIEAMNKRVLQLL
jgi:hypothetical protein